MFRLRWPWYIGAHLGENKAKLIIKKIARETVIHMKNSYAERLWTAVQLYTRLWLSSIVCYSILNDAVHIAPRLTPKYASTSFYTGKHTYSLPEYSTRTQTRYAIVHSNALFLFERARSRLSFSVVHLKSESYI